MRTKMETSESNRNLENEIPIASVESDLNLSLLAIGLRNSLHITSGDCKSDVPDAIEVPTSSHVRNGSAKPQPFTELQDIVMLKCPFCSARLVTKCSMAVHALRIHQKAVVSLLHEGSTEKHLKCLFCVFKVMHRHHKVLLLHLEKKHALEFVAFLWERSVSSCTSAVAQKREWFGSLTSVSALQDSVASISQAGHSSCNKSHNLTSANHSFSCSEVNVNAEGIEDCSSSKIPVVTQECNPDKWQLFQVPRIGGISQQRKNQAHKPNFINSCAKRKLLMDGMLSSQPSKCLNIKEIPSKESLYSTLSQSGWKHAPEKQFACGRCKEAFTCNALLLDHIRTQHRGCWRLLQPLYTCGLCSASFYKNSFLVRHCYYHHTPK